MADLIEHSSSVSSEYSLEFDSSHDQANLSSELKKTLNIDPSVHVNNSKKPPISKREDSLPRPSDGVVDLRRTIRSPIAMAYHLNHDDSEIQRTTHPSPNPETPLTFKQVVGTVQKLQFSAKKFRNSDEIRDVVYKEWRAKKEVKDIQERRSLTNTQKTDAEKKLEKELEMSQRSTRMVKKWTESKELQLQTRQKKLSEEKSEKAAEAEEKQNRSQEAREAAKRWREVKHKELIQRHVQKKKVEEEEGRRKEEEEQERKKHTKQVFQSWNQRKEAVLRESNKKKRQQVKKEEQNQRQEAAQRQMESKKSFATWKSHKDEKIKSTGTLYTYNKAQKAVHERAWCPARSMHYNTVKSKGTQKPKLSQPISRSSVDGSGSIDSYSMSSFESEPESDAELKPEMYSNSSSESTGSSILESVSRAGSPSKVII